MLAEEDVDTIATYWAVIREMSKDPDEPDPNDGAATLRGLAQKYGG